MKFVILSDIHGNKELAEKILKHEYEDDYKTFFISLGDTELNDDWVKANFDFYIKGNNDFFSLFNSKNEIYFDNNEMITKDKNKAVLSLSIEHGHLIGNYDVLINKNKLQYLYEKGLILNEDNKLKQILLFGHSHFPLSYQLSKNKFVINPGSISYPRFGSNNSYCVLKYNVVSQKVDIQFFNPLFLD
ncbi:metallophosphoesterase family protein [Mycoplasmopsis lipofaciens]|uniref:metallophosphoesterase family protein n=1 Tax=Mycoplasmopsis lipofaciens TaxID=114884 RepID=UPI0004866F6D|nr:metallophosphoesterase family protein [Mycoplasmopsis lipofaciens]